MYSRLVRALRPALRHSSQRQFTVTAQVHVNKTIAERVNTIDAAPALQQLLESEAPAILYSSYVDDLTPGWRQASQQERRTRREKTAQMFAESKVRPFSLALQYMNDTDGIQQPKSEEPVLKDDCSMSSSPVVESVIADKRNWMQDYESYRESSVDEDDNDDDNSAPIYGTPDPSVPVSRIPCHGCGSLLQCAEPSLPGYLPSEIFAGQRQEYLKVCV